MRFAESMPNHCRTGRMLRPLFLCLRNVYFLGISVGALGNCPGCIGALGNCPGCMILRSRSMALQTEMQTLCVLDYITRS